MSARVYRIDRVGLDGSHIGPVTDLMGPRLDRSYAVSKVHAVTAANDPENPCHAYLFRISGPGSLRCVAWVEHGTRKVRPVNTDPVSIFS